MLLIDDNGTKSLSCSEIDAAAMRAATSKQAARILELLASQPNGLSAAGIAKALKKNEQNVHYHISKLTKADILIVDRTEDTRGGMAKILRLHTPSYAITLRPHEPLTRLLPTPPAHAQYLSPFIDAGKLDCIIVIGSPDPHGPEHARSRDATYAVDLGLFLGSFLTTRAPPSVVLDTELHDWNHNLIIIGGPVVNKAAERINAKSPASYDRDAKAFYITNAKRPYAQEEVGIITRMQNPYAKGKWVLHITGKRHSGTRAAVIALVKEFNTVCATARQPDGSQVTVVLGMDADSDGIIDSVKFLE